VNILALLRVGIVEVSRWQDAEVEFQAGKLCLASENKDEPFGLSMRLPEKMSMARLFCELMKENGDVGIQVAQN
jgi:hypothetical protein